MHVCTDCETTIKSGRAEFAEKEKLEVLVKIGKEMCLRCVSIVVNWMTGEELIPTGSIDGWKNN